MIQVRSMSYPKYQNRLDGVGCLYLIVGNPPTPDEMPDVARVVSSFASEYPTPGSEDLIRKIKQGRLTPAQVVDQVRAFAREAARIDV